MIDENEDESIIELTVPEDVGSKNRLDQYLADALPELSRARVQKLIESQDVLVNGAEQRASFRLKAGDKINLCLPPPSVLEAQPENIPIKIVYEDEHLIVIDKPPGMVTHPGAGVTGGTLVNAVLFHCAGSLSSIGGVIRPGIVHRLDKDTSGLIVVAKTDQAHAGLSEQLQVKSARRSYLAICEGAPRQEAGTVETYIGRHPVRRKEMAVLKEGQGGRRAVTHYKILTRFAKFTLVGLDLDTGRTHQIRVHMAHLGAPVAGDLVYNPKSSGNAQWRAKQGLQGHALHACKLAFTHPVTGLLLKFEAPPPEGFEKLLNRLK